MEYSKNDAISKRSVINVTGGNDKMATLVHINENDQKIIAKIIEEYNLSCCIIAVQFSDRLVSFWM